MFPGIRREIGDLEGWLVEVRRDLHRHPELKFEEHRTARVVADYLRQWGLEVKEGVGGTGVVGLQRGEEDRPVLGLRADMDALPIQEVDDRPYASETPGIMHACGHDAHVTMLLGAARYFSQSGVRRAGGLKFIFQAGEEGGAGGRRMVEEGVLEDPKVERAMALHVFPTLRAGQLGFTPGPALASVDDFVIRLSGRGSHAAHPHHARDPILAGAALVQALQSIVSRSTNPMESLVVSVTRFMAGTAYNIIPEEAEIWGTIRSLQESVRSATHEAMRRIAQGVADAHGVQAHVDIHRGYPVLRNDPGVTAFGREVARSLVGEEGVIDLPPSMGAEDFSYFLERCPGAFVVLGCGRETGESPMLHTPHFDIEESALPVGVEYMVRCAEAFWAER